MNKYNTVWLWDWSSFNRGINLGYSIVWWPRGKKRVIVINMIIGSIIIEDIWESE